MSKRRIKELQDKLTNCKKNQEANYQAQKLIEEEIKNESTITLAGNYGDLEIDLSFDLLSISCADQACTNITLSRSEVRELIQRLQGWVDDND